jgi:NAD(P)-dependent dehydrogenase (short-subunit alcohol dehydrogenase family)
VIAWFRLPPFIATLGMYTIAAAGARLYTDSRSFPLEWDLFSALGSGPDVGAFTATYEMILWVALTFVLGYALNETAWGVRVYAIGNSPTAARLNGVNVTRVVFSVYTLAGVFYAFAVWQALGRTPIADPSGYQIANLDSITDALTLDDSDWRRAFDANLDSVWMASQIVGRHMVTRGAGSIVNIGSISGFIVNRPQWNSPYAITKAAVHHLTKSLAAEWATQGVRVNAIAQGYVKMEIANSEYEDYRHYWRDEVPMRRYASPDEIAPTALLLASDAGSFITGSVFVVDGGYMLW